MPGLATGVAVAGSLFQGISSVAQANTQARILQQQAQRTAEVGRAREADFRQRVSRAQASQRAVSGIRGVDPASGSPLGVSEDFAAQAELQALRIRNNAAQRIGRLQTEQSLVKRQGVSGLVGSFGRAGASFLRSPTFGGNSGQLPDEVFDVLAPRRQVAVPRFNTNVR